MRTDDATTHGDGTAMSGRLDCCKAMTEVRRVLRRVILGRWFKESLLGAQNGWLADGACLSDLMDPAGRRLQIEALCNGTRSKVGTVVWVAT